MSTKTLKIAFVILVVVLLSAFALTASDKSTKNSNNPFAQLWAAIEELEERIDDINGGGACECDITREEFDELVERVEALEGVCTPSTEVCDGVDNDCDGLIDEGALWANKGDACIVGTGACQATGTYICNEADPAGATICDATAGTGTDEICDGIDNDCDGETDEDWPTLGEACSVGIGACQASGEYVCTADHLGIECDAVAGAPEAELCDGVDNDCDGSVDEGLTQACYTGPAGTLGVGPCSAGTQSCISGVWGECIGEVTPDTEICDDSLDNDCDGETDGEDADCGGPRFLDHSDGTVEDLTTGLFWLKDATCLELIDYDIFNTDPESITASLANGQCDLTDGSIAGDWRIPSEAEWTAFLDTNYFDPPLCNAAGTGHWTEGDAFTNILMNDWSYGASSGKVVSMYDGDIFELYCIPGTEAIPCIGVYIWPVRDALT